MTDWNDRPPEGLAETICQLSRKKNWDEISNLLDGYPNLDLRGPSLDMAFRKVCGAMIEHGPSLLNRPVVLGSHDILDGPEMVAAVVNWASDHLHERFPDLGPQAPLAQALLERGARPDASDRDGTSLMHAARHGNKAIVNLLVKAGANPDAMDDNGMTGLMVAADCGSLHAMKLMLGAGANPWTRDTALSYLDKDRTGTEAEHTALARVLVPAMFDQRWWKGRTRESVQAAWGTVPEKWRAYGQSAYDRLSSSQPAPSPARPKAVWTLGR